MESVGQVEIIANFEPGTNPGPAPVDVQNRLSRAAPRLPRAVTQQGVRVDKAPRASCCSSSCSTDGPLDPVGLGDYMLRNVLPEIQRMPGVGQAQLFGTERAMRIWIDPAKLVGFDLSADDVNDAIRAQNAQVSSGTHRRPAERAGADDLRHRGGQGPAGLGEQFGNIVLRANADGSTVRLRDVARIELGGAELRHLGAPERQALHRHRRAALAHRQRAGHRQGGARRAWTSCQRYFPPGVSYDIPYDSSRFVKISISQVVETLVEAVVLVFLVMFLFLQNIALHADPDHRRAGGAARHLRACCWRWASRSTC